jgi:hypothetical protein
MEENNRTKKFRANCQMKSFNHAKNLLTGAFKKGDVSQKDIYKLANGHELPSDIKAERKEIKASRFERMKKLDKINENDLDE